VSAGEVLFGEKSVPLTYMIVDLLRLDGEEMTTRPYRERRVVLEGLALEGRAG
jgi:ATP-dependent DNA ligase